MKRLLKALEERHLRIDRDDASWPNRDRLHAEPGAFENSIQTAIAGRWMSRYFNRPGLALFSYHVIAVANEGEMPENIVLPAHLQLSNLVWIYLVKDQRQDELVLRFMCEGWNVVCVNRARELDHAFRIARNSCSRPTLIVVSDKARLSRRSRVGAEELRALWTQRFRLYAQAYPELAEQIRGLSFRRLPELFSTDLALRCFSPI